MKKYLLNAHVLPHPYLEEASYLGGQTGVHAAIDVSDGLGSDLGHILDSSRVGARLFAERIPVSPQLNGFCAKYGLDPLEQAVRGGEDYTLLVTMSPDNADAVQRAYEARFGKPLFDIGEITEGSGLQMTGPSGAVEPLEAMGWDHFKKG